MHTPVAELFAKLVTDTWRTEVGFSQEVQAVHHSLFKTDVADSEGVHIINDWIQKWQPCLFGKIGAKLGLISYCVLNESDLSLPDDALLQKIQTSRTAWTKDAFEGKKSAFVILVVSPTIAGALPNEDMKELACRICSLYLLEDVEPDRIHLDEIFLEMPGSSRTTWKWNTGVNYFCSQGDGRWWQDHRIPGGMAFSVNSVGHMIKSGILAKAMAQMEKLLGAPGNQWVPSKVDSPEDALQYAMLTIDSSSDAVSGRATELLPLPSNPAELPVPKCPVQLPKIIQEKNFCEYQGYYHTDYTLPSEYFLSNVERLENIPPRRLDFTYLIAKYADKPDLLRLVSGQQIRAGGQHSISTGTAQKYPKAMEQVVGIDSNPRLARALGLR